VIIWIGRQQSRLQHGYRFKQTPLLEPLDHIECRDALVISTSAQFATAAKSTVPSPAAPEVVPDGAGEGGDSARPTLIAQPTRHRPRGEALERSA